MKSDAPMDRRTDAPKARMLLIALCISASVHPCFASAQNADSILNRAMTSFQNVTTLRADFTQLVKDEMIGTNSTSRGEFLQQRPNRFAMRWRQPPGDVILSDGAWLWIYLPSSAPGQAVKSAVSGRPGQSPDVVAEFLERPRERFTISYVRTEPVGGRTADVLSFVPKQSSSAYRRVMLWIDRQDNLPHQVEINEASGTLRRITLDKLRINTTIPASSFSFRPPSGVRVVDASRPGG
jgi:outer membrane lipoprotein carrier protein